MPELPEVQTICDVLAPQIIGRKIEEALFYSEHVLTNVDAQTFSQTLRGSTFLSMSRRGKYMMLALDHGFQLIVHLRMTGCLLVTQADYPFEKHTHVVLELHGGMELRFIDQRRFGRMWVLRQGERLKEIEKLGPEPWDDTLTAAYMKERIGRSRKAIKECLLDQTLVAGIGNIYSDEILHCAGIHPQKKACILSVDEFSCLTKTIPEVMRYFTEANAISPERYLQTGGREYQNTPYLRVYGRAGQKCLRCEGTLQKMTVGGRGSVYCPHCQRLDENG